LAENFPFLAQIAANYEEYEWMQLIFHFRSTVDASISSTGTTGTLVMATNYNADAPSFQSKEEMMQYHGANNMRCDRNMNHGVECAPSKNSGTPIKYTRTMPPTSNENLKDFDIGKFQWALVNIPSQFFNQQIGELWVTYKVKLMKPRLATSLGRTISEDRFISNGGTSNQSILGTQLLKINTSNIGVRLSEVSPSPGTVSLTFQFPDFLTGRYELLIYRGNDAALVNLTEFQGNCVPVRDIWTGSGYIDSRNIGENGVSSGFIQHVDVRPAVAAVNNEFTCRFANVDASDCTIYIRPYNPDNLIPPTWKRVDNGAVVVPS
jgi:hypothetical protein